MGKPLPASARRQAFELMAQGFMANYAGASRASRSVGYWLPSDANANESLLPSLPDLTARSHDLYRNSPIARAAINTPTTKVVGTGLAVSPKPANRLLGMSESDAQVWADEVKIRFEAWFESTRCDLTGRMNGYGLQALAFRSALLSGDCFALLPMSTIDGDQFLAVQLVEGMRVSNPSGRQDSETFAGGLEFDRVGRPVAVHIANQHPSGTRDNRRTWVRVPWMNGKYARRAVLHLCDIGRPGQARGEPYLAPVIETIKQLTRATDAEVAAAVIAGIFAIFIESESGEGIALEATVAGETGTGGTTATGEWDGSLPSEGGLAVGLAPGEKATSVTPGRPNSAFDPFAQAILGHIGMALEIPKEVLSKTFLSSYSAARAALLEMWQFVRIRRAWLASQFCQPIYETWLMHEVAEGRIQAPGMFEDPAIRWAWARAEWVGDGPGSIDPTRDVSAAADRVSLGISTLEKESLLFDGSDWRDNLRQRKIERAVGGTDPAPRATPPQATAQDADQPDEKGDADGPPSSQR